MEHLHGFCFTLHMPLSQTRSDCHTTETLDLTFPQVGDSLMTVEWPPSPARKTSRLALPTSCSTAAVIRLWPPSDGQSLQLLRRRKRRWWRRRWRRCHYGPGRPKGELCFLCVLFHFRDPVRSFSHGKFWLFFLRKPCVGELWMQKLNCHLLRTQSLNILPLKPGVGQGIAIHATLTARDFFLAYFYIPGPFTCIFSKTSPDFFPVLAVADTGFLCWVPTEYK